MFLSSIEILQNFAEHNVDKLQKGKIRRRTLKSNNEKLIHLQGHYDILVCFVDRLCGCVCHFGDNKCLPNSIVRPHGTRERQFALPHDALRYEKRYEKLEMHARITKHAELMPILRGANYALTI